MEIIWVHRSYTALLLVWSNYKLVVQGIPIHSSIIYHGSIRFFETPSFQEGIYIP